MILILYVFSLQNYPFITLITYDINCTRFLSSIQDLIVYIVTFLDDTEAFFISSYLKSIIFMFSQTLFAQSFFSPLHILYSYFYWKICIFCQYLPFHLTHWLKINVRMSSCTGWMRHNSFFLLDFNCLNLESNDKIASILLYFCYIS